MLSDIAKFIRFKSAVYGEDLDWAMSLCRTGFLQTEYRNGDRVHYIYNVGAPINERVIYRQQNMTYQEMLDLIFTPAVQVPRPSVTDPKALRLTARGFVSK
jgi:hypothetical protein